jgi:DNA (cytosine-5)-methyltransferase 1
MIKQCRHEMGKKRAHLLALSLFSGAGGMDIGIRRAGFEILACVENDPYCCETLRACTARERLDTAVIEDDVRQIEPKSLMQDLGLRPGEIDLIFGGPPCQAFSQIGKQQGLNDERGLLLFEMLRFAKVLQPKAVFLEQVTGLLSATHEHSLRGEVLQLLLSDLDRLGYVPKWAVLNSADYGVPQLRRRLFVVATRKPNGFEFPIPTNSEKPTLFGLAPYKTVGEALKGLPAPSAKGSGILRGKDPCHVDVTPTGDRFRINGVPEGLFLAGQTHLAKEQRKNLTHKDTTKFLRVARNRPSNTLRCGEIFFHWAENRYLTPREYMRLHGYPDSYILQGPIRGRSGRVRFLDQHRQVANSVPPPLAEAVGKEIVKAIECLKQKRSLKFSKSLAIR